MTMPDTLTFREQAMAAYREIIDTPWPLASATSVDRARQQLALLEDEQPLVDWGDES